MIRNLLIILFIMFASVGLYAQSGALKGKVVDSQTGEAVPFANIVVELNGNPVGGGVSDFDGQYQIKPIPAGKFTVKASYVGYKSLQINDVLINNDKVRFLDLSMESTSQEIDEIVVVEYSVPLIDKDNTQQGGTVTSEEIQKMAGRSAEAIASTVGGIYQEDGEVKSVRGSREGSTVYYIDGVKITGDSKNLPKSAISEVSVVTGGLPARYGDATGGVISITTKGASRTYFGGIEMSTSKFLDDYNENILGFNLSGPLLTRKVVSESNPDKVYKEPLLGFFIAGEYNYIEDEFPSAVGVWRAKSNILDSIIRTPIFPVGSGNLTYPSSQFLQDVDFENIKTKQNVACNKAMISGKIDFQPLQNLVITVGGNLDYAGGNSYDFTTRTGFNSIAGVNGVTTAEGRAFANQLFNSEHNPEFKRSNSRAYARLTQKFDNNTDDKTGLIRNAYYTVQADYSLNTLSTYDPKHTDNLFNYGYIGKFNTYTRNTYEYGYDTTLRLTGWLQNGFQDTLVTFQSSDINSELARYTELFYDYFGNPMNTVDIEEGGGLLNGQRPGAIYNIAQVPGEPYNRFRNDHNDQIRVSAYGSADIGNHEVSLGFEFEKRTERQYLIRPVNLWDLARNYTNFHILELDYSRPIMGYITDSQGNFIVDAQGNKIFNDTVSYPRLRNASAQSLFDIRLRKSLGMDVDGINYIDIDSYDPSQLSVDYFSADELFNNGSSIVSYYGYDAYGNILSSNPTFEDFFTKTFTENGRQFYSREIAPFEPIYMAGYIQDKFAFNDLIFNIGLRVDYYDANQMVQKDKYNIYDAYTVGDVDDAGFIASVEHPGNISDNAVIYVDNKAEPGAVLGYRDGNVWYNAQGSEISDPTLLYSSGTIHPYLKNANDRPGDATFLSAFTDYEPKISLMPRISFSFPISDEALFFAHYDILTRRPFSGQSQLDPYYYLYIEQLATDIFTNANLKPEKTIDYELGFQQKLNNFSSIKLSAFVREQRDMIQILKLTGAYPINMTTYDNIDFGTIKGFTLGYDLRRVKNLLFKGTYTLQFANATGSDANTGLNLINSGQPNLRTTLPTDIDQRHQMNFMVDYRFSDGKNYNGPKWFGKDILANAGCNFVIQTGSGTPYTKRDINTDYVEGRINGSVMPWRTTVSLKVDKSFTINLGKDNEGNQKFADLNVYFDVSNLFNTMSILKVYSYTGNPDDDGYLSSAKNQSVINSAMDRNSYVNYYSMLINNPERYIMPRRMRLGVLFSF